EHPGLPGSSIRRRILARWPGGFASFGEGTRPLAEPADWFCFSELQFAAAHHGFGECSHAVELRRAPDFRQGDAGTRRATARQSRADGTRGASALAAVRWPTTARRHCPFAREPARLALCRRTYRQLGFEHERRDSGDVSKAQSR